MNNEPVEMNVPADSTTTEVAVETKVKLKKEYDHATKSYVQVPKNVPLKVLVAAPRTSKRHVIRYIKSAFRKVNFLDGVTRSKKVAKRRAQNRIASKMKWANYHRDNA